MKSDFEAVLDLLKENIEFAKETVSQEGQNLATLAYFLSESDVKKAVDFARLIIRKTNLKLPDPPKIVDNEIEAVLVNDFLFLRDYNESSEPTNNGMVENDYGAAGKTIKGQNSSAFPEPVDIWKVATQKLSIWGIVTLDSLLLITHLTVIYVVFLYADDFILSQIERSFGDLITHSSFVEGILNGTQILSALGTALAYGLHLIYSLYLEAKHVSKTLRKNEKEKEHHELEY